MMFRALLAICLVAAAVTETRAATSSKIPNQILDRIVAQTILQIKAVGWDKVKKVQTGSTVFNITVNDNAYTNENFAITNANITGLGTLRRSASAVLLNSGALLKGTIRYANVSATASYTTTFPGVGAAPANTVTGTVTEKATNLFADIQVALNATTQLPQNIVSYVVRSGHDNIDKVTGQTSNAMKPIDLAGIRHSLLQIMTTTVQTNMKVMLNQAIQALKNGTAITG